MYINIFIVQESDKLISLLIVVVINILCRLLSEFYCFHPKLFQKFPSQERCIIIFILAHKVEGKISLGRFLVYTLVYTVF